MPDFAPNAELLRSLGRLVRGLSTLFWGLPVAVIVCSQTGKSEWFRPLGALQILPPLLVTAWLLYGVWQLEHFQKQERIWRNAVERAKLLAFVNLGLAPFLYWWNQFPYEPLFTAMVLLLAATSLLFLAALNRVLQRLTAMLPDETLRLETKQLTTLNCTLLLTTLALAILFLVLHRFQLFPITPAEVLAWLERLNRWQQLILPVLTLAFLLLLPLAMTMALLWKIKEVILQSVFGTGH